MDAAELDRQIAEAREKGFDESFTRFCADTFSAYEYPPENLAAARMHVHYLRLALEALSDQGSGGLKPGGASYHENAPWTGLCLTVAGDSWRASLASGKPFCEVFVEMWCSRLSLSESGMGESGRD